MDFSLNKRIFLIILRIKSGDLVIEYTGEVIRRALADIREKQYIEKGFGDCYMFGASLN